jgi:hypothetical protein
MIDRASVALVVQQHGIQTKIKARDVVSEERARGVEGIQTERTACRAERVGARCDQHCIQCRVGSRCRVVETRHYCQIEQISPSVSSEWPSGIFSISPETR